PQKCESRGVNAMFQNETANRLNDSGQIDQAIAAYQKAIEIDGSWPIPWYNIGLIYKTQRKWMKSLQFNRRAVELDPTQTDAWWNRGIAATALSRWSEAREAWTACGIHVPAGDGPIEMELGPVPIRLNPDSDGEVIWTRRIDPARAIILNVPL